MRRNSRRKSFIILLKETNELIVVEWKDKKGMVHR